jgi:hypothetical protein
MVRGHYGEGDLNVTNKQPFVRDRLMWHVSLAQANMTLTIETNYEKKKKNLNLIVNDKN